MARTLALAPFGVLRRGATEMDVYMSWYNNGRYHLGIKGYPEVRYSGHREVGWIVRLIKAFNLEEILVAMATE